jgi:hypothetical protein
VISDVLLLLPTLLAFFVPGAAVGTSLGLRPWTTLAAAPALTLGLVAVAGTIASRVPFSWGPGTFAAGTAVVCGVIVLARWLWHRRGKAADRPLFSPLRRPSVADLVIAGGVAVGWLISAVTLVRAFGSMSNPNQNWDYVFHSNAVRLIADTGNASPAALGVLTNWEAPSSFYPNAFHALGAIVTDLTGAPVFDVLNAQTMMISGVAGLGLAALLRSLSAPVAVSATTPVLLAGFASFPYDILAFGPLLPYAMAVALLPAFFLLLTDAFATRRVAVALACGLAAGALLGVQTSIALSAALAAIPLMVHRWMAGTRTVLRDLLAVGVAGVGALAVAFPYAAGALAVSGGGAAINWPAIQSVGQSVGDLFLLNHAAPAPQYWLAALMIVGLLTLGRARYMWWWLAGGAIAFALFVAAASSDSPRVEALTGPWWNDRYRFAALAVLAFAPLAASGLYVLADAANRTLLKRLPTEGAWGRYRLPAVATALLLAVVWLANTLYMPSNERRVALAYQFEWQLSHAELDAMRWLAHQPGASAKVMNDPNDGSPFMSAAVGLHPVFGHVISPGTASGQAQRVLLDHFNCLDNSSAVRRTVQDLDIRYVFVSDGYVLEGYTRAEGLRGLSRVRSLEQVYAQDRVRIYRVQLTSEVTDPAQGCETPPPS